MCLSYDWYSISLDGSYPEVVLVGVGVADLPLVQAAGVHEVDTAAAVRQDLYLASILNCCGDSWGWFR